MRDVLGTLFTDQDFVALFPLCGQPAYSPWQLALVTIMQFAEGLSDRQAADAVRARIDWKYALNLDLTDAGFDFSLLSEFRTRLLTGHSQHLLLDTLLTQFKHRGLLKGRGQQRTDSTHVLAAIRNLNRLQAARQCQKTAAFRAQYTHRAGIEGTLAQTIRMSGLRQARYIGLEKVHVQQVFTAAARNMMRATDWLAQKPKRKPYRSSFATFVASM
jgi:transposase